MGVVGVPSTPFEASGRATWPLTRATRRPGFPILSPSNDSTVNGSDFNDCAGCSGFFAVTRRKRLTSKHLQVVRRSRGNLTPRCTRFIIESM